MIRIEDEIQAGNIGFITRNNKLYITFFDKAIGEIEIRVSKEAIETFVAENRSWLNEEWVKAEDVLDAIREAVSGLRD